MSSFVRIYVPVTSADLQELRDRRELRAGVGFTVTDAVRTSDPNGEDESWEHAAMQDAAAATVAAGAPVVVIAADVPAEAVTAGQAGSRVEITSAIPLPRIASVHVGDDVLSGTPLSASPADAGSEIELSWYDTTELDQVVRLLRAGG